MPKISELPVTSTVGNTAVWPVLENNAVQKISFANFKSAVNTPATTTVLGAVKIGTGISVSSEGLISVTIPTASSGTIGGVKVAPGSNLTVNGSGVLSLKDNILFGNGSRINATDTDVLAISSALIDINTGGDQYSSGEIIIRTSDLLGASITIGGGGAGINMQGIVYGQFNGNFIGQLDGNFVGNVYEPGYDGSQNPIFNATLKRLDINHAVIGDISVGEVAPNYIGYSGDQDEFIISVANDKKVRIDNLKNYSIETSNITTTNISPYENGTLNLTGPVIADNIQVSGTLTSGLFVPASSEIIGESGLTLKSLLTTLTIESGYGGIEINGKDDTQEITRTFIKIIAPSNSNSRSSTYLTGNVIIDNSNSPGGSFTLPRYTTTARNALGSQFDGTLIYNTTTNKVQAYANGVWVDLH